MPNLLTTNVRLEVASIKPAYISSLTALASTGLLYGTRSSCCSFLRRGSSGQGLSCDWATRYICNSTRSRKACRLPPLIVLSCEAPNRFVTPSSQLLKAPLQSFHEPRLIGLEFERALQARLVLPLRSSRYCANQIAPEKGWPVRY